jgi:hypothetical protein
MKRWFRLTVVPGGNSPTGLGVLVQLLMFFAFMAVLLILASITEQITSERRQWVVTPFIDKIHDNIVEEEKPPFSWEPPTAATATPYTGPASIAAAREAAKTR